MSLCPLRSYQSPPTYDQITYIIQQIPLDSYEVEWCLRMGLPQDAYRRHLFFDKDRQLLPVYHAFVEYCVSRDLFLNRPQSLMDSWWYRLYPRETDYNFRAERGTAWRAWKQ